jgi:hypothetical protein
MYIYIYILHPTYFPHLLLVDFFPFASPNALLDAPKAAALEAPAQQQVPRAVLVAVIDVLGAL